jgi:hypothetical protein
MPRLTEKIHVENHASYNRGGVGLDDGSRGTYLWSLWGGIIPCKSGSLSLVLEKMDSLE